MSQGCYLEEILNSIGDIGEFEEVSSSISSFSRNKKLYTYQQEALYNCLKLMSIYYGDYRYKGDVVTESKKRIIDLYDSTHPNFSWENRIRKYTNEKKGTLNDKFSTFVSESYFDKSFANGEEFVSASEYYNRCAFWMATASGKSVVIIKLIDMLKSLMDAKLIPEKPILLLTPKDFIIEQIIREGREFNISSYNKNKIEFLNLKEFDNYEKGLSSNTTEVVYYRSDLIREKTTESFISHHDIDNDGNWYVILDEAHRGDNDLSLSKGYFTILSRNGFLFNFSATFADAIDFQTTLYNFNLERFIEQRYGKNIFVSDTLYTFKNNESELDEHEKQKEVLKSFIIYTAVKGSIKKNGLYHSPLLMTLVGTVNTEMSDLKIYFRIIELIATGKIDLDLFEFAKFDLLTNEICGSKIKYSLGEEELDVSSKLYSSKSFKDLIAEVSLMSIIKELFNSNSYGRIEFVHSKDIQEIGMKLETADEIFGLIKIGERDKFENNIITDESNYTLTKSISTDNFFGNLESDNNINMLCGSRAFYEGWDTNRPNVINLIDIGSKDAQKFVPQAIGRGIRIKPNSKTRLRLPFNDPNKNQLLETLFVFATNKDVLDTIVGIRGNHHNDEREYEIALKKNESIAFDLIIPHFSETKEKVRDLPKYNLTVNSYNHFRTYFLSYKYELLIVNYNLHFDDYCFIRDNLPENIEKSKLFTLGEYDYSDMSWLLKRIIVHIQHGTKKVDHIDVAGEDTIRHFKRVRLYYDDLNAKNNFLKKVDLMSTVPEIISDDELWKMYDDKQISRNELNKRLKDNATKSYIEEQDEIILQPIINHYYLPLIYSKIEDNKHIGSVIKVASERDFVINLINQIPHLSKKWYFSKLLENVDDVFIPYFSKTENRWRNFYSDFIFWIEKDDKNYEVYFVDPKGTKITDYEQKVYYYKKLFFDEANNRPIEFMFNSGKKVRFLLRLITDDINKINESNAYKGFWYSNKDFSFLE
jgi:superfamily II DNA or RNA helicase